MCALSEQSLQRGPRPAEVQALPGLWPHQPPPEGQLLHQQQRRVWRLPARVSPKRTTFKAKPFLLLLSLCWCQAPEIKHTCVCVRVPSFFFRYYRKTKLSGFQDMGCIPCGDPPPPYEPHCKCNAAMTTASTSHQRVSSGLEANTAAVASESKLGAACVRPAQQPALRCGNQGLWLERCLLGEVNLRDLRGLI